MMGKVNFGDDFKQDAVAQITERAIRWRRRRNGLAPADQEGASGHPDQGDLLPYVKAAGAPKEIAPSLSHIVRRSFFGVVYPRGRSKACSVTRRLASPKSMPDSNWTGRRKAVGRSTTNFPNRGLPSDVARRIPPSPAKSACHLRCARHQADCRLSWETLQFQELGWWA